MRQQRTPYSRSKVKTGAPPTQNNIAWTYLTTIGAQVNLQLEGSSLGLVRNGDPTFEILGEDNPLLAVNLVGDILELQFTDPPTTGQILALQTPSIAIRNRFGGLLNSGFFEFPPLPAPPTPSQMQFYAQEGNDILLEIISGNSPYYANSSWTIENTTIVEAGGFSQLSGNIARFNFATTPNSGDDIGWPDDSNGFRNVDGGGMLAGSFTNP